MGEPDVHLRMGLDAECVPPLENKAKREKGSCVAPGLTEYGVDRQVQDLFSRIRTDLDYFSDTEALSLEQGYVRDIQHFALRGIVRPGVTGWAQINQGYAHAPDEMRSKLEYDLYYLKHCSLWLDLVIVLRTFAVVFRGTGAS